MIDDFTPIINRLEGRTIRVWPIADVHIGARECDMDGFAKFLKRVEADDDSYIVRLFTATAIGVRFSNPRASHLGKRDSM